MRYTGIVSMNYGMWLKIFFTLPGPKNVGISLHTLQWKFLNEVLLKTYEF